MCNQRYLEMYRIPQAVVDARPTLREVLAGHYARGIFRGGPGAYVDGLIRDIRADEVVTRTVETADGRVITVRNRLLANGNRIATHEDITERHTFEQNHADIEARLREQKMQLDTALNNMSQGLCMFDAIGADRRLQPALPGNVQAVAAGGEARLQLRDLIQHRQDVGLLDADPEEYVRKVLATASPRATPTPSLLQHHRRTRHPRAATSRCPAAAGSPRTRTSPSSGARRSRSASRSCSWTRR